MTEIVLLIIILAQQAFWMYNTQRLVNKLMSRNFYEFVHSEKIAKAKPVERKDSDQKDDYAASQAEKANKAFGLR